MPSALGYAEYRKLLDESSDQVRALSIESDWTRDQTMSELGEQRAIGRVFGSSQSNAQRATGPVNRTSQSSRRTIEHTVDVVQLSPQERISERIVERGVLHNLRYRLEGLSCLPQHTQQWLFSGLCFWSTARISEQQCCIKLNRMLSTLFGATGSAR